MTANDTNRAVALLRAKLPERMRTTPFIVQTDSDLIDGVAFCNAHPPGAHWRFAACNNCHVIETHNQQLAERIVALLRAAGPLAAHLNALEAWDHLPKQESEDAPWSCGACGELGRQPIRCPAWSAADIAQAINGTGATTS